MIVETQVVRFDSLPLDCGVILAPVEVAYETYRNLTHGASNAILLLHAFSAMRTRPVSVTTAEKPAGGTT